MISLLVLTDGRDDVLARTLPVAAEHVPYERLIIHDDTGSLEHRQMLANTYRHFDAQVIGGSTSRVRRCDPGSMAAPRTHPEPVRCPPRG